MSNPGFVGVTHMLATPSAAMSSMHHHQIERDLWPDWSSFDPSAWPLALRREAARQWASRAVNEHSSVQQFSAVLRAATDARLPISWSGALARLITDEARHAELCGQLAVTFLPDVSAKDELLPWSSPVLPWEECPTESTARLLWIAKALLQACCFGETLSVPMLKALAMVSTEPVAASVAKQILRDEHLHARFGVEGVVVLLDILGDEGREALQEVLPDLMRSFEVVCCQQMTLADFLKDGEGVEVIEHDADTPNLGTLSVRQYAAIFYATMEHEIFPMLTDFGLDPGAAWVQRG